MEIRISIRSFLLISLLCSQVKAFTLNNSAAASFKNDEIKINIAEIDCPNLDNITYTDLLDIAQEAANRFWNTVPTSSLELVRGSVQSVSSNFYTEQICSNSDTNNCTPNAALVVSSDILISCNNNSANFSGSSHVLAVGAPNNIDGENINGALILINDSGTFDTLSRDEQIAVIAHELGHAVGLGHSQHDHNLMYYSSVSTRYKVGEDDSDGISWLYPSGQPFSGGCGTINLVDNEGPKNGFLTFLLGVFLIIVMRKLRNLIRPNYRAF
jgi:hypothetical protein